MHWTETTERAVRPVINQAVKIYNRGKCRRGNAVVDAEGSTYRELSDAWNPAISRQSYIISFAKLVYDWDLSRGWLNGEPRFRVEECR